MSDKEIMQNKILNAEVPEELDIDFGEIMSIYELGKNPFDLICHSFVYGLIKGGCKV